MTAAFPEPRPQPTPVRPGPLSILLRLALGLLALAIPLFAVWLTTSLVLAVGAPLALALPLGIAVPLVLPIVWDFWAEARWRKKPNPPARILARSDRIRLRILATCLLVIGLSVFAFGRASGDALARHGAWFMFGSRSAFAADVQSGVQGFAARIAGLTGQTLSPFEAPAPLPEPTAPLPVPAPEPVTTRAPDTTTLTRPAPEARPPSGSHIAWPWPLEVHPVIRGLTDAEATSISAVAAKIGSREADPFQRVKAIHDFVVRWVAYDTQALRRDYDIPPQDGPTTFARRTGTCDGYVQLMIALGEELGLSMTRVVGRSRAGGSGLDGFYHSWVGVVIDGRPWLVDPTWDAGSVFGNEYRPRYATSYFLTPPEIFAYDHLPNDPAWSLVDPPLDERAFLERPALSAHFFAWGLSLEGVTSATTEVTGRIDFRIRNPKGAWVLVLAQPVEAGGEAKPFNCVVPSQANPIEAGCMLSPGTWQLELYANDQAGGRFPSIGFLRVVAR